MISQRSACLSLLSAEISGVHYHAPLGLALLLLGLCPKKPKTCVPKNRSMDAHSSTTSGSPKEEATHRWFSWRVPCPDVSSSAQRQERLLHATAWRSLENTRTLPPWTRGDTCHSVLTPVPPFTTQVPASSRVSASRTAVCAEWQWPSHQGHGLRPPAEPGSGCHLHNTRPGCLSCPLRLHSSGHGHPGGAQQRLNTVRASGRCSAKTQHSAWLSGSLKSGQARERPHHMLTHLPKSKFLSPEVQPLCSGCVCV